MGTGSDECVVVIGAGLVGASIGMALVGAGHRVHLRDRVSSHARVAAGLGAGTTDRVPPQEVDLVVVAVPPAAIARTVLGALERYPHAVVTDVGSVKGAVLSELAASGADLSRYVGSHPMAGSQHAGPLTSSADLFVDRTWVVTPHAGAASGSVERVERLARDCGGRVVVLDAREHDEAVAQVSHLPQLMSSLTAGRLVDVPEEHLRLAGQGIRDVTRIAASDPDLWQQIVGANAEAVRTELMAVQEALAGLVAVLDDPAAVREFIARGRQGTRALPGKHGHRATDFAHVVVEIPDTPGALARLFADIEEAGVNVEDLAIEHDEAREVGYLSVAVTPDREEALTATMVGRGWTVRP
ncbi:MAG: prephenate dehydrogenase [Propionibacteriaceae bacterium]